MAILRLRARIRPQKIPQAMAMSQGDILGRTVYFSEPYVASYFSRVVFWVNNIEIVRVLKDPGP